jgi:cytochrome b-561
VGGVLLQGLLIGLLTAWPWLDKSSHLATGVWLPRVRARQNTVFLLVVLGILILTFIGMAMRGPYWYFYWPWEAWPDIPARI